VNAVVLIHVDAFGLPSFAPVAASETVAAASSPEVVLAAADDEAGAVQPMSII
jgi:hypothetical protein